VRADDLLLTPRSEIAADSRARDERADCRRSAAAGARRSFKTNGEAAADEPRVSSAFSAASSLRPIDDDDADLQLIDADPSDPFDFYPEKYNETARRRLLAQHAKRRATDDVPD
jgi:hypothetical protein